MTEIGEGVGAGSETDTGKSLSIVIVEIWFDSGIDLYDRRKDDTDAQLPPSGQPHWGSPSAGSYPAAYVRQGGSGETKKLRVKLRWFQRECDGEAKLIGAAPRDHLKIEGSFSISGETGEVMVDCEFVEKPTVVKNYRSTVGIAWGVEGGGMSVEAQKTYHPLYFLDAAPRPIGWSYKRHYHRAVDWSTQWSDGKSGASAVFAGIWAKFAGPRVPHATGYAYWKTRACAQKLMDVVHPTFAAKKGWSCKGIAHLFMECLALHGVQCQEIVVETYAGTAAFLVKNWRFKSKRALKHRTDPYPEYFYAGPWRDTVNAPTTVVASLKGINVRGIDCSKRRGVPAQGQRRAPPIFGNHWIVRTQGKLYDTSYGGAHVDDIAVYTVAAIDGWLMAVAPGATASEWWTLPYEELTKQLDPTPGAAN